jgi:hypothetical protein
MPMKLTADQVAGWEQVFALFAEILAPSPSELLLLELRREIGNMLFEAANRHDARDWIAKTLAPAKRAHRLGVYALKHAYEWDRPCKRYIRAGDFAQLLTVAGFRVEGDRVYCREVRNGK